jgi:HEXXH motif-containing protein
VITPLTISERDFALLAAGAGDRGTVETLLAGQFSRRVLLVLAVLDAADRGAPGVGRSLRAAYALLAGVQRTHPDVVRDVLTLPVAGNWASVCLRDRGTAADDADYRFLACLAASAAIRAGHDFEIDVPVRDGTVCLPACGTATVGGDGTRTAVVTSSGDRLAITAAGTPVRVPADRTTAAPGWRPVRLLRVTAAGLELSVWLEDSGPFRLPAGLLPAEPLTPQQAGRWQATLSRAWQILVRRHPEQARAMAGGLQALTPLHGATAGPISSATAMDAVGAVLLTPAHDAEGLALTLLHEFQHVKLAALSHLVTLLTADSRPRFFAPWRADPRPLDALLQGAYAHLGVAGYWRARIGTSGGHSDAAAQEELAYCSGAVREAIDQLAASECLAPAGRRFLGGMTDAVRRLDAGSADGSARRRAAERLARERNAWIRRNAESLNNEAAMR